MEIRIEDEDGNVKETLEGSASEEMYEFEKVDMASLYVPRPEVDTSVLDEDRDRVYLVRDGTDEFGGILRDEKGGGSETELVVESFERLARDAEPTSGGETWSGVDDSAVIQDAIDNVSGLTAGTIETVETGLSFVFSHASQAKKMREVAEATGGELFFYPDGTVDYVETLGSDKSDTTISPGNQNISEEFNVSVDGSSGNVTHLRMLGAGEGDAQIKAEAVDDDWSQGDYESWETRINKDISDPDTLASHADTILDELNTPEKEIETTVEGPTVELGDRFHLSHPEEDVDETLRAVEVTRIVDANGERFETVFSNRRFTRKRDDERVVEDTDRYNLAFEGSPVTINTGGGRQPVTSAHNYQFDVYYPAEVEYEHRVKLQVSGMAYRAYSSGAASNGGSHRHSVSIPDHSHDFTYGVPDHRHTLSMGVVQTNETDGHTHGYTRPDVSDPISKQLKDQEEDATTTSDGGGTTTTSSSTTPSHTHDPEPGLIEFQEFPSNCDVLVNGQSAGVSMGDGSAPFTETVDLAGMLTAGTWNTIEVTSDSIGHIMAALDVDVYRQILGRG